MQRPTDLAASQLQNIVAGLITLSRLNLLAEICERRLIEKRALAERAARLAEVVSWVLDLQKRYLHRSCPAVTWPTESTFHRQLEDAARGDVTSLKNLLTTTEYTLRGATVSFQGISGIGSELATIVPSLVFSVISSEGEINVESWEPTNHLGGIIRAIHGPPTTSFDPAFAPTYSVLDEPAPVFADTLDETVPFFWTLAVREANAADICALSAVEFDGLPHEFYRDFAKQCWDETRHSLMFFNLSVGLLPELKNEICGKHRFLDGIEQFLNSGHGLPVPKEGGLYEAVWNAALDERLVLMQIRTEAPAVEVCKRRQVHALSARFPAIASSYQIDEIDETSHAAIGWRWFRHICPDDETRREAIERTDLLRGFLLTTSIAAHGNNSVATLCERILTNCGTS